MGKIYKSNMFFLYLIVGTTVGGILLGLGCNILGINDIKMRMFLSHFLLIFVPSIIFIKISKGSFRETLKLKRIKFKDIILVIGVGLLAIPMSNSLALISSMFFENTVGNLVNDISTTPFIILLLLIAVMPAITEEVSLRGVILSGYDEKNIIIACLMNGILFGLFHLNAHQFIYATVLGFVLAYAVRVTGSLFASMIIHFMVNGTAVLATKLLYVNQSIETVVVEEAIKLPANQELIGKLMICGVAIIIAGALLAVVIKLLNVIGKRRGVEVKGYRGSKEKIINLPLIVSIICYILLMITIMI